MLPAERYSTAAAHSSFLCHQFLETKERRRIHNADDAIHMHHIVSWNVIAVLAKNRQLPN
jgi:hypothetical protein